MVNEAIWVKNPPRNTVEDDRSDSYFWQVTQVKSVSLNHDAIVIVPRLRLLFDFSEDVRGLHLFFHNHNLCL